MLIGDFVLEHLVDEARERVGGGPLYPSAQSSQCFCGYGSGTWASLAYAAGLGGSLGSGRLVGATRWGLAARPLVSFFCSALFCVGMSNLY